MKKRIAMALSMIVVMLMLCACGTDPTAVDYNGHSYEELESEAYMNVNAAAQLASFFAQNEITEADVTDDLCEALASNYGFTEEQIAGGIAWMEVEDEYGEFQSVDEESFRVEKAGNTLTTDLTLQFEKRAVDFQVVYTYYSMDVTGLTVEPIYSLGEKMSKAGMNTVISVTIVFVVLILISLIIACFNVFPYLEKKKAAKKQETAPAAAPVPAYVPPMAKAPAEETLPAAADDSELVAVIAAAIAASTGTDTSGFVVRSIRRR